MTRQKIFRWVVQAILIGCALILAPTFAPTPLLANGYLTNCTGEYFNNVSLSGAAVHTRTDATLNFFWPENTSPAPGVAINNYSVRWTCGVSVASAGNYTVNILTDDGMNVLVDGNLVLWAWYDQGPAAYSATVNLSAGAHTIRVEYYNRNLGGTAQVSWTGGSPSPTGNWKGDYFNNQTLSGSPTITRYDAAINFMWGTGSPDPSIPVDHFSVRWTTSVYLNAGTYRITTTTDDGVRVWVNGTRVIDQWRDQAPTAYTADVTLATGNHAIQMEYYENVLNAQASLTYALITSPPPPTAIPPLPPGPTGIWRGYYYKNISLAGNPDLIRDDPAINFNWYENAPFPGFPVDFSARWESTQFIAVAGNYPIVATSDDGVRVWIDGALVIDGWYDHGPTTFTANPYLSAGAHAFRVDWYDRTLGAMIVVQIGGTPPPPPPPVGDVIVDDRGPGWRAGGASQNWRAVGNGIGGHAFWTFNNTYAAQYYNWARWYPTLPRAGYYEVLAYIPAGVATTLNARYWVYHNNRYDLAVRSQAFYANQWVTLGTHYFHAQGGENVSLSDVTYECYLCRTLVFDAIMFSPR